jgi:hypothetical protein
VQGLVGADAAFAAGGGFHFELEVDEDGEVVGVGVGPAFELVEALEESVADRVRVAVCDVEDFEARLGHVWVVEGDRGVG